MSDNNRYSGGYRNDSRRGSGSQYDRQSYDSTRSGGQRFEQYDSDYAAGRRSGGQRSARYYEEQRADRYDTYDSYGAQRNERGGYPADRTQQRAGSAQSQAARRGYEDDARYARYDEDAAYERVMQQRRAAQQQAAQRMSDGFDDDFDDDLGGLPRVTAKSERRAEYGSAVSGGRQGYPARERGYDEEEYRPAAQRGEQRPAQRLAQSGTRYSKKSGFDSFADKFTFLGKDTQARKISLIIIASVLAVGVLLGVVIGITQCGDSAENDIPTIEQGDPEIDVELFGGEVISGGDGQIIINEEGGSVDDFTVAVTGADGTYGRTGVSEAEGGTLTISNQDSMGFNFDLKVGGGVLSGYAYFTGATTAMYELEGGLINFSFESEGIKIYHTVQVPVFNNKSADGTYVGNPVTIEEQAQESEYNADVRNEQTVRNELIKALPESDFALMESIFTTGACPTYQNDELTYDKNGKECTVDSEMKAVKYYAFVAGTGEELVLICRDNGQFYLGLCDGSSYRYYTNDEEYKDEAPKSISGQAQTKSMTLKFV